MLGRGVTPAIGQLSSRHATQTPPFVPSLVQEERERNFSPYDSFLGACVNSSPPRLPRNCGFHPIFPRPAWRNDFRKAAAKQAFSTRRGDGN